MVRKLPHTSTIVTSLQANAISYVNSSTSRYAKRLNLVIDYIYDHLNEDLSVEHLSEVANFSKFHFHRQFSNYTGITVFKLVQLLRLRRAAYELTLASSLSVLDIAMNARFESAESFSRAFKKAFGQTPSQFRKSPKLHPWQEKFTLPIPKGKHNMNVIVDTISTIQVAALEHRKSPALVPESVETFIQWRNENNYSPSNSRRFGIIYDDPENVAPEDFRFDLCGEISTPVKKNSYGVISKTIAGGDCAVLRHEGTLDNIRDTVCYLYSHWLPESGRELRDFPCFFHYMKLASEVPEHEQITDVYLPLE